VILISNQLSRNFDDFEVQENYNQFVTNRLHKQFDIFLHFTGLELLTVAMS